MPVSCEEYCTPPVEFRKLFQVYLYGTEFYLLDVTGRII